MKQLICKILLNIYFWPMFVLITIVGLLEILVVVPLQMLFLRRPLQVAIRRQVCLYGWVLTQLLPFFAPVKVEYEQPLPAVSILTANHNSAIDPYLFGSLPIESGFITSWPFHIPIYGTVMRLARYANTEDGWEEVRRRSFAMLEEGCSILIWPEGHRSRTGMLGRFRNGAFSLAVESGVPVVPVCIFGARDILAPGQRFLNCGRVRMVVLEAIYPESDAENKAEAVQNLRKKVHDAIEVALREKAIKKNG